MKIQENKKSNINHGEIFDDERGMELEGGVAMIHYIHT
jgi:hypothetical protein